MLVTYNPGDVVCYVDQQGRAHKALVTHWIGKQPDSSCNLVYLDPNVRDVYGLHPTPVCNVRAYDGLSRTRTHYWIAYPVSGEAAQGQHEGGL